MTASKRRGVAVVTGGARGIGKAIAQRMAADGFRVVIGDVDADLAATTAAEIDGASGLPLDVTDFASFASFLAQVEETYGPVDVLVNNAGIMPIGPFLEQDEATARRVMDINVHGPLNGMRAVLPSMIARGSGHVVNIASTAGKVGTPGGAVYSASKHAVVGLSDALRQEYGARGIAVTVVLPSFTNTELVTGTNGLRGIRTMEPTDVADAVAAAIRHKRAVVYVPGHLKASALLHDLLPTRVNDLLMRAYGGDRAFLDIDHDARAQYETRIGSDR